MTDGPENLHILMLLGKRLSSMCCFDRPPSSEDIASLEKSSKAHRSNGSR